jgi:prepilin-type N-terminal cleavage/methylation domain-containing protein
VEKKMKNGQGGFTLVEIAIVLVIIGLLLGGVLKGQELINSAKVKNIANDFRTIPLFIYGYQDKFKRLPGDDPDVAGRFGSNGVLATGPAGHKVGNGIIEGQWDSKEVTDENVLFWQHARLAGVAAGSTDFSDATKASLPSNAEGGQIGIQMTPPIKDLSGTYYVCSTGINSKLAQQLDTTMDDGAPDRGTVRAQEGSTTSSATGGASKYDDGKSYTVCQAF